MLCAIYNIFDGTELLIPSMRSIADHTDYFILVWQNKSNYGEQISLEDWVNLQKAHQLYPNSTLIEYVPNQNNGTWNEKTKRNLGIQVAKNLNATHIIQMDCDEFYEDFGRMKDEFTQIGADGSVCEIMTYFKRPTLRFSEPDNYFVPFIHKLHAETITGVKNYPHYVDPTRRINTENAALISGYMHHFSYVRKDIEKKARNSSAKNNIELSDLLKDYHNPDLKEGYFVKDFRQKLIKVPDLFNLSEIFS